jgi:multidrug efflux pump
MFSHFFIERPIFASVLSIVITLAGWVAVLHLPLAQYPPITPPTINVQCTYPGANAYDVADSVAAPIEQQVNGVEDMLYMVSQSNNDGTYNLSVTFRPGVNLNFAQVLVQNRINLAMPLLPDVVKQAGVTTRKRNPDILQVIAFYSPHGRYDQLYLSNFATIKIKDELARVEGVGDVQQFGQQDYSMRIWVDPDRLASLNLSASDVANAVREQNRQVAAGRFGQEPSGVRPLDAKGKQGRGAGFQPAVPGQAGSLPPRVARLGDRGMVAFSDGATTDSSPRFDYPITTLGRLTEPEQFADIVLRTDGEGRAVRLKDVGHVALGAKTLDSSSKVDLRPNASLAVWALPDANSIATARRVRERMEQLKKSFPDDLQYTVSLDMTPFIQESINEVVRTLIEAVILVAIVVMVFLQNWRSAIIPLVAVPVAIVGTFGAMAAIGFSLNTLTLFGLVLAVGIVVDDAIVVVEAVERHIEEGLTPHQAAHAAMKQVSGPVVAVALVLSAVFVPCAFITGITGMFFRQFALTIAVSTVISAFNSLTLSPALAALLLRPRDKQTADPLPAVAFWLLGAGAGIMLGPWLTPWLDAIFSPLPYYGEDPSRVVGGALGLVIGTVLNRPANQVLRWFFQLFNWAFQHTTHGYTRLVGLALRGSAAVLVVYCGLLLLTWWTSRQLPSGYIPNQDQGRFYIAVQLPDAASLERTQQVTDRIAVLVAPLPDIVHVTEIAGQSFTLNANGSNFGQFFVTLEEFDKRRTAEQHAFAITDRLGDKLQEDVPEAQIKLLTPPPVSGLGTGSGFKIIIEDRSDLGQAELQKQVDRVMEAGNGGHFKLTAKSLADLRAAREPPPEPVLEKLGELVGHDYLTRTQCEHAVDDAIKAAGINDRARRTTLGEQVLESAENHKVVSHLFSVMRAHVPQLYVDINRDQCQTMGVNPKDVFSTLQIYLGSLYVNDFNRFGRTWQVIIQALGEFRDDPERIKLLKVRNNQGQMVPLGSVIRVRDIGGPINIGRYNMYPAAAILGATEPGVSTGQGIEEMEALCKEILPKGMAFEWTEINYMQLLADENIMNKLIFPLAVMFVFLVLAAQYESWSLPLAVILVVPMCILGSLTGVALSHDDINVFTQIGFVVLVGLASKNAILIVEFAKHKHEEGGLPRREATLEACQLRLRPILMTSFAFILGVVPLLVTTGAGAEMRRTLGTAVFSGMLGVTLFGIFLTPVFFYMIAGFADVPLFSSHRAHQIGLVMRYLLGTLTLGLPWLLHGRLRPELAAVWKRHFTPVAKEEGEPGAASNGTSASKPYVKEVSQISASRQQTAPLSPRPAKPYTVQDNMGGGRGVGGEGGDHAERP